ncbi:hypothetical protein KKF73_06780, partial [Patescibacteria group bacterium]|nr:hypothetical protein [Patescibacteria group bacterium]
HQHLLLPSPHPAFFHTIHLTFTVHACRKVITIKITGGLLPIQCIFVVRLYFAVFFLFFSFSLPKYCEFNIQGLTPALLFCFPELL